MPHYTPVPQNRPDSRWEVDLVRPFAEGGFGAVYRGKDKHGDSGKEPPKDCAAKKMLFNATEDQASYDAEISMLRAVGSHNNIISLFGNEQLPGEGWLFLEMATGGELFDRLIDSGSLSERAWPATASNRRRNPTAWRQPSSRSRSPRPKRVQTLMQFCPLARRCGMAICDSACLGDPALLVERCDAPRHQAGERDVGRQRPARPQTD